MARKGIDIRVQRNLFAVLPPPSPQASTPRSPWGEFSGVSLFLIETLFAHGEADQSSVFSSVSFIGMCGPCNTIQLLARNILGSPESSREVFPMGNLPLSSLTYNFVMSPIVEKVKPVTLVATAPAANMG